MRISKSFLFRSGLDRECRRRLLMTGDFGIGRKRFSLGAIMQLHVWTQQTIYKGAFLFLRGRNGRAKKNKKTKNAPAHRCTLPIERRDRKAKFRSATAGHTQIARAVWRICSPMQDVLRGNRVAEITVIGACASSDHRAFERRTGEQTL